MTLNMAQVCERVDNLHLDELDLVITRSGDGFAVTAADSGDRVEDIGSLFEVPDTADERGRYAFTAGPWTGYQYHAGFYAPHRDNYRPWLDDLAAGDVTRVIVGLTAVCESDTWVLGVRAES